jgi:ribonuclease HII
VAGGASSRLAASPSRIGRRAERRWRGRGATIVAGVDEAGRGPLAGPVVAAAVVIGPGVRVHRVDDSKLLSPERREVLFERICARAATAAAAVGPRLIDRMNILRASHLAMRLALERLPASPDVALVDGLPVPDLPCPHEAIVDGDALEFAIACASVVAKVTRDRMMALYDAIYPRYGFAQHKGYATPEHLAALERWGPSPIHRISFSPLKQIRLPF